MFLKPVWVTKSLDVGGWVGLKKTKNADVILEWPLRQFYGCGDSCYATLNIRLIFEPRKRYYVVWFYAVTKSYFVVYFSESQNCILINSFQNSQIDSY